jgi:beta-lactamase regulating signal transducer with metallopeptidase domain
VSAHHIAAWAIEALLASALLMVLVLVAREPVRRAFGPQIAYALWLLPVLRLLMPPLPRGWHASAATAAPLARAADTVTVLVIDPIPGSLASTAAAPAIYHPSLGLALGLLWAVGAAAFLLWHVAQHTRFCRRILSTRLGAEEKAANVHVIESAGASGPIAFGVLRKYVAFPRDFAARYDADERDLALAHELGHHARGDLIANWAALVVLALHWFNPFAWRAFRAFRADQEMANDARVLAGRSATARHIYACAIVKAAHGGTVSAACHLHTVNDLKGRLKMLAETPKSRRRVGAGLAATAVVTLAGLGLTASGTAAAEKMRVSVEHAAGVTTTTSETDATISSPEPSAVPETPATPQTAAAPQTPVVTSDDDMPAPPAPPAPPSADAPPSPPAPPEISGITIRKDDEDATPSVAITTDGKTGDRGYNIVVRDRQHNVIKDVNYKDIPEVRSASCPDAGSRQMVINDDHGPKHKIIICTNRIDHAARDAARTAANSKDIERNAYQSALKSLQSTRDRMANDPNVTGDARREALAGIDESIADIQADMADAD